MRNRLKLVLIALILFIVPVSIVNANTVTYNALPGGTYIIGSHIFTRENGALTLRKIMFASRTIPGAELSDMKIVYKTMIGTIVDTSVVDAYGNYAELDINDSDTIEYDYRDLVEQNTTSDISLKANALIVEYYNKYNFNGPSVMMIDSENELFDEDNFYELIGDYTGSIPESIKINETNYAGTNKYFSIGYNAFLKAPVWKIKNNKLYVAVPWLIAESMPGVKTNIKIDTKEYSIDVFDQSTEENTIELKSAHALYTEPGFVHTVNILWENDIYVDSAHGNNLMGFVLTNNGVDILNTDQNSLEDIIYRLDNYGNMAITKPEIVNGIPVTFATYPLEYGRCGNELIEKVKPAPKPGQVTTFYEPQIRHIYKLALPNKGTITVQIVVNLIGSVNCN